MFPSCIVDFHFNNIDQIVHPAVWRHVTNIRPHFQLVRSEREMNTGKITRVHRFDFPFLISICLNYYAATADNAAAFHFPSIFAFSISAGKMKNYHETEAEHRVRWVAEQITRNAKGNATTGTN